MSAPSVAVLDVPCPDARDVIAEALVTAGWVIGSVDHESSDVGCVVYDPGFLCPTLGHDPHLDLVADPARAVSALLAAHTPGRAGATLRMIGVSSRDALGSSADLNRSSLAAAVIGVMRGVALAGAPAGHTANTVCAAASAGNLEGAPSFELLPSTVSVADIAAAITFFADRRSNYITGQTLYVCGGESLLSSLSV